MTEQIIFDNKNVTSNSEQISILKKHFPNCFDKEGNFLIDSFKEILTCNNIDTSHEGYKLSWLGKSYARLLANEKPRTLIRPDNEHNTKEQNKNSNNLLIKGDNLEVLKHLKNAYTESVKVIYIDPPYNTGSDGFVYKDDRKFTKEELANLANVSEEEAQRILDFTDKGSNSHSAWLTFIYPRLYVARELLSDDGVIFISIDDNEQAQLKLLCDEVFGEENFVASFIVVRSEGGGLAKQAVIGHDYLLTYSKNTQRFKPLGKPKDIRGKIETLDGEDYWIETDWLRKEFGKYGTCPYEEIEKYLGEAKKKEIDDGLKNGLFILVRKNNYHIVGRYRKISEDTSKFYTILKHLNKNGVIELNELGLGEYFDFPKPLSLVKEIVLGSTILTKNANNIILDFFAGSSTTAHAVKQLNIDDGGNRQYIMVQLPEPLNNKTESGRNAIQYCIDNNLEQTIFSICKSRIEKAAEKLQTDNPDYKGDLGFKIFETIPLPENYNEEIDILSADTQTKIWDGSDVDEKQLEAILTTWTLYDRILLTTNLESIMLGEYKAYYGIGKESNTLYLMYKGFNIDHIRQIIDKLENDKDFTPKKIVVYGHNFETKSQRELSEAINSFRNKKQLEIDIIKRY